MEHRSDYLVIGSGIAGLSFALKAAQRGTVALVTKRAMTESATYYAQGGIASVSSKEDTFEAHIKDTIEVGAGLCKREVVEMVVRDAPRKIDELMRVGVEFTKRAADEGAGLDLGKEGGHSKRRIVHAGDLTGKVVEEALVAAAKAGGNIAVYEEHMAVNLIVTPANGGGEATVRGAYVLDKRTGAVHTFLSRATVLATGGAGKVYLFTSNPDVATGDGIAMAYRAGAEAANMEFIQFHPTCLYHPKAKGFLISEALRGEGARLVLRDGSRFM